MGFWDTAANVATGGHYGTGKAASRGDWKGAAAGAATGGYSNYLESLGFGSLSDALKDKSLSEYISFVDAGRATGREEAGMIGTDKAFSELQDLVARGPGASDVTAATGASRSFADMLKQYAEGGYMPGQSDIDASNSLAGKLFAGQREAMNQSFQDQMTEANRRAALMGRSMNDPILAAKLGQEQTRQQRLLDANQGSWAQQYALSMPGQRLGYEQARVNVLGGLATQAMTNRQAIAAMGEGIVNSERQFRLATATRFGKQTSESGGGLKDMLGLGIAAAGVAMPMFGAGGAFGGAAAAGAGAAAAASPAMAQAGSQAYASQQYFNGPNPYSMGGPGFGAAAGPQQNMFSGGGYQFGSSMQSGPRTYSLGGY